MAHLTLAGLSEDGKRLLLVSDKGVEFTLDVDARLRAALRGEHARLGQLEIKMDSALRPRDIQARIRSGESPESVAQAAQTTVDKIMPFAAPVLAERQHVAERAQRSSVRRKAGDTGARTLGDAVSGHLRALNVDPTTVEWDSCRREDGRWTLTGEFAQPRVGHATFTYDAPGNYVVAENDDARWLIGDSSAREAATSTRATSPRDDLRAVRERRLSSVSHEQLPLGDDAIEMVSEPDETSALGAEQPVEAFLDDEPPTRDLPAFTDEPAVDQPPVQPAAEQPSEEPTEEKPATRRKKGRASVPSWDEIMFGGGKGE